MRIQEDAGHHQYEIGPPGLSAHHHGAAAGDARARGQRGHGSGAHSDGHFVGFGCDWKVSYECWGMRIIARADDFGRAPKALASALDLFEILTPRDTVTLACMT